MSSLTKFVLGMMGQLRPRPAAGAVTSILLPTPEKQGGLPLMDALAIRHSLRDFSTDPLPSQLLSNLLWAAYGINRNDGGRTAPSALNAQEIDIFLALPDGAYRYDARANKLRFLVASDIRRITGYQDFVDDAPLDLIYVADYTRMNLVPVGQRESYASIAAGAITQNVYCLLPVMGWLRSYGHGSTERRLPMHWD